MNSEKVGIQIIVKDIVDTEILDILRNIEQPGNFFIDKVNGNS